METVQGHSPQWALIIVAMAPGRIVQAILYCKQVDSTG